MSDYPEIILHPDIDYTLDTFIVGAVCQYCGKDIKSKHVRAIVFGGSHNYHVCGRCINNHEKTKEAARLAIDVELRKLEMKKAMEDFKKRIYG